MSTLIIKLDRLLQGYGILVYVKPTFYFNIGTFTIVKFLNIDVVTAITSQDKLAQLGETQKPFKLAILFHFRPFDG